MNDKPTITGTPDDWWENAEEITSAEATERDLGNWYITQIHNASGNLRPSYRVATPNKPPNVAKRNGLSHHISSNTRCLFRNTDTVPAWKKADMVIARDQHEDIRAPWIRKPNGTWQNLHDLRQKVTDYVMQDMNPIPAKIVEEKNK